MRFCFLTDPARSQGPVLEEIAAEHADKIEVVKLNVDENPAIMQRYGIMNIPRLGVFSGGEVIRELVGARSKSALLPQLADFL